MNVVNPKHSMLQGPESPSSVCCPDPAGAPMQKISLFPQLGDQCAPAVSPATTVQPSTAQSDAFTTDSSHLFPPSLSDLFSPSTPSKGIGSSRSVDILQYNSMVNLSQIAPFTRPCLPSFPVSARINGHVPHFILSSTNHRYALSSCCSRSPWPSADSS